MLAPLCVAYAPTRQGGHALAHAAGPARRAGLPLTVLHVMAHTDDPGGEQPSLADELLGAREDVALRRRLATALLPLTAGLEMDLRVFKGPRLAGLAEALRVVRPGVVLAGAGSPRALASVRDTLHAAPCPVGLVRAAPVRTAPLVLALTAPDRQRDRALAAARDLAADLGAGLLHRPAPRDVDDHAALLGAAAAMRRHAPLVTVVTGERWHGLRRRTGRSPVQALVAGSATPLLVVPPWRGRSSPAPRRDRGARRPLRPR